MHACFNIVRGRVMMNPHPQIGGHGECDDKSHRTDCQKQRQAAEEPTPTNERSQAGPNEITPHSSEGSQREAEEEPTIEKLAGVQSSLREDGKREPQKAW